MIPRWGWFVTGHAFQSCRLGSQSRVSGTNENSPPFQRRESCRCTIKSPQGTADCLTIPRMSHRYESLLVHCVFSTKDRKPIIPEPMKRKLWAYIGGIARTNNFKALAVGGMLDHVHVLLSLPATLLVAKAVQLIKGGSSKWLNDHLPGRAFAWQDAYGVFTIGISQVKDTIRYINTQEEHHAKITFAEEWRRILDRHGIAEFSR
jgi:putative transposase